MALQNFVDFSLPVISAAWLNRVDSEIENLDATIAAALEMWSGDSMTVNVDDFESARVTPTDDTPVIQAALNYAATVNGRVVFSPKSYYITAINVPNGVAEVDGEGSKLFLKDHPDAGIRLLGTVPAGAAANVSNCTLRNLYIDANAVTSVNNAVGIWGQNASAIRIINNVITGMTCGHGILLRNYSGPNTGGGNIIYGNRIIGTPADSGDDTTYFHGIGVDVNPVYEVGYSDAQTQWKATFLAPNNAARMTATATSYNSNNIIANNYVYGAYAGVEGAGLVYSTVSGNVLTQVIRGVSLQQTSYGNVVMGNTVQDNWSGGIHFAYGSTDNTAVNNKVYTSRGASDPLLTAYVGSKNNTFVGNDVTSTHATGPKGGMYAGVHSDGNVFNANRVRGNFSRFGMGVESAWLTTTAETNSWAYAADVAINSFANAEMFHVVFSNNVIELTNAPPAAIYVGQHDGVNLNQCRFIGNQIIGNTPTWQLRAFSQNNTFVGFTFSGNVFAPQAEEAKFFISTNNGFLYYCRDNTHLNYDRIIRPLNRVSSASTATAANSTTPSVAIGDFYYCVNTVSTTITDFLHGDNGRELLIRLDTYTGIAHNTAKIVLKGAANITAGTADAYKLIRFIRYTDVWVEVSRNW